MCPDLEGIILSQTSGQFLSLRIYDFFLVNFNCILTVFFGLPFRGKISMSPVSLHFFKHEGIVYVTPDPSHPDLEEVAIECEAEDVTMETNEEGQEMVKVSSE